MGICGLYSIHMVICGERVHVCRCISIRRRSEVLSLGAFGLNSSAAWAWDVCGYTIGIEMSEEAFARGTVVFGITANDSPSRYATLCAAT